MPQTPLQSQFVTIDTGQESLKLHYQVAGEGTPVLLIHGWPTSAHLWRKMLPILGAKYQVIAVDLPGFGLSEKPLDISYSFRCYDRILEAFVDELSLPPLHLVVHDLGGPVGLFWAVTHPERIKSIGLLNTIVFPEVSWAVKAFMIGARLPGLKWWLTSRKGLEWAMRFGVENKALLTPEVLDGYTSPFKTKAARQALLQSVYKLHPKGLQKIADGLVKMTCPVRMLYAEQDRILPTIAKDFQRLHKLLPEAELTSYPKAGHFLQEEIPEELSNALLDFWRPQETP